MAKGKVVIEVSVNAQGAISSIQQAGTALDQMSKSGQDAARETASLNAKLNNLLNRLDPVRAATQRYERDLSTLKKAFEAGKISAEEFARAQELLKKRLDEQTKGSGGAAATIDELTQRYLGISVAGLSTAAAIGGVVTAIGASIKAAAEAEEIDRRLEAVIKATGGTAGLTAQQMSEFASQLQQTTGYGDEAIKQAMAVLATFRSVSGDTFKEAIKLSLDLSAVFGQDLQQSAIQLGKALEDPIQGLTALRRVGVSFSEEQQNLIKALVESGEQLAAQEIILKNVAVQVGGAAEAVGQGLTGSYRTLKEAVGDAAEALGGIFVPILSDVTRKIADQLAAVNELIGQAKSRGWKGLVDTLGDLYVGLGLITPEEANQTAQLLGLKDATDKAAEATKKHTEETVRYSKATEEAIEKAKARTKEEKRLEEQLKRQQADLEDFRRKSTLAEKQVTRETAAIIEKMKLQEDAIEETNNALAKTLEYLEKIGDHKVEVPPVTMSDEDIANMFPVTPGSATLVRLRQFSQNLVKEAAGVIAPGISDSIIGSLQGEDFQDAWKKVFGSLGQIASGILDNTFKNLLSGEGSFLNRLKSSGWFDTRKIDGQTITDINWSQIGMVGGTLLWGYGASQGNRGMGALGGALAGASIGMSFSPVGAIIGAIIGGIVGYFTSGAKTYGYNVSLDRYGRGVVDLTGVSQAEEDERLRQMRDTALGYFAGFRQLLETLNQAQPDVSGWRFAIHGQAGDISSLWRAIMTGELPRSIFQLYKPGIEAGLTSLGVSEGRIGELMGRFDTGQFQEAIKELQDYINALIAIKDLHKELGKSLDQLRDEWKMTIEERLRRGTQDVLDQITTSLEVMDQMTGPEQVARAQQLVGLIQQQANALVQYIQQIFAAQQQAQMQADQMRFSWEQQKYKNLGGGFYETWLMKQIDPKYGVLFQKLQSATDLATVQQVWQQALSLINEMHGLGGSYARLAETYLDMYQQAYKSVTDKLAEQAKAQLQKLDDALGKVESVLTSESKLHQDLTTAITDERDARREYQEIIRESGRRIATASEEIAAGLGLAAAAAATASTALATLATTAAQFPGLGPNNREVT